MGLTDNFRKIGRIDWSGGFCSTRTFSTITYESSNISYRSSYSFLDTYRNTESIQNEISKSYLSNDKPESFNTSKMFNSTQCSKSRFTNPKTIKILTMNCQSCREVASDLNELMTEEQVDIGLLCETWLRDEGDEAVITSLTNNNFDFKSFPRLNTTNRSGGSIAILMNKNISKYCTCTRLTYASFECVEVQIKRGNKSTICTIIYRRRPTMKNKIRHNMFFEEFSDLLSNYCINHDNFSIHGDFNYHFDDLTII